MKQPTKKATLEMIGLRLESLRKSYIDPRTVADPQLREAMCNVVGQITALDEVRLVLLGVKNKMST